MNSRQRDRLETRHLLWQLVGAAQRVKPIQGKQNDASPGKTP